MSQQQNVTPLRWRPQLSFAARLRLVRLDYAARLGLDRLSQDAFAAVLGVKPGTYGTWEAGNNKPANLVAFAKKVSEITGCDPAWLLDVADDAPNTPPGQEIHRSGWTDEPGGRVLAFPDLLAA